MVHSVEINDPASTETGDCINKQTGSHDSTEIHFLKKFFCNMGIGDCEISVHSTTEISNHGNMNIDACGCQKYRDWRSWLEKI